MKGTPDDTGAWRLAAYSLLKVPLCRTPGHHGGGKRPHEHPCLWEPSPTPSAKRCYDSKDARNDAL